LLSSFESLITLRMVCVYHFFSCYGAHPALHSFPTRRSSDLGVPARLLIGPWTHIAAGNGLPVDGVPSVNELELRWYDHYLRGVRSEEHTSELQSRGHLVCRLLLEKKKTTI